MATIVIHIVIYSNNMVTISPSCTAASNEIRVLAEEGF